jgi:uncharacterized protein (TIGR02996 family)
MSMHEQFLSDLLDTPDDRTLRGVYADWCEDNDQPEAAECLRWMAAAGKRPMRGSTGVGVWFNGDTIAKGLGDEESDLPDALYRRLEGGGEFVNHRAFGSLPEAERAIQAAWVKARKAGWTPDV